MNKNIIIIIAFLFSGLSLSAQNNIGVKVAAGKVIAGETSAAIISSENRITHDIEFVDFTTSKSVGIYANRDFGFLFVQGEALYTNYNANYMVRSYIDDNVPSPSISEEYNNLDLHVLGGVKINNLRLGVGPVLHKSIDFNSGLNDYEFYNEKRRDVNMGFQAMVAYDLGPVRIDLKYEDNFSKVGDHIYNGNNATKLESDISSISLGLGIGF